MRNYIQSALRLPDEEKREREVCGLKSINDSFKMFVITENLINRYHEKYNSNELVLAISSCIRNVSVSIK